MAGKNVTKITSGRSDARPQNSAMKATLFSPELLIDCIGTTGHYGDHPASPGALLRACEPLRLRRSSSPDCVGGFSSPYSLAPSLAPSP